MFSDKRARVLATLDEAHAAYYQAQIFGGPSLHFHVTSLRAAGERDINRFTEQVYAVLASWGMHRMGPGGSKMRDFDEFRESICTVWPKALPLQETSTFNLSEAEWSALKEVFQGIRCMASGTTLVGNSKVMAHLLPNLVPPIDREYTLKLLYGNGQIVNGLEREWVIFREVLSGFFHPLAQTPSVRAKASEWMEQQVQFKWDTSVLKILDNLVIGCTKMPGLA